MKERGDPGARYFRCTDGERAAFEAGIKLGTIYHQYMGTPVTPATAATLERSIEEATRVQPFVELVRVRILRGVLRRRLTAYGYTSLTPEMLAVRLEVLYQGALARCELRYVPSLGYPLMMVHSVEGGGRSGRRGAPRGK